MHLRLIYNLYYVALIFFLFVLHLGVIYRMPLKWWVLKEYSGGGMAGGGGAECRWVRRKADGGGEKEGIYWFPLISDSQSCFFCSDFKIILFLIYEHKEGWGRDEFSF